MHICVYHHFYLFQASPHHIYDQAYDKLSLLLMSLVWFARFALACRFVFPTYRTCWPGPQAHACIKICIKLIHMLHPDGLDNTVNGD